MCLCVCLCVFLCVGNQFLKLVITRLKDPLGDQCGAPGSLSMPPCPPPIAAQGGGPGPFNHGVQLMLPSYDLLRMGGINERNKN